MSGIYLSYRRKDADGRASRLELSLAAHFGTGQVSRDISMMEPDLDSAEIIERSVGAADAFVALIGGGWLGWGENHPPRIGDPRDFVRMEVEAALTRNDLLIVPILVERATMPAESDLPPSIRGLTKYHPLQLRGDSWDADVAQLIATLAEVVRPSTGRGAASEDASAARPPSVKQARSARKLPWSVAPSAPRDAEAWDSGSVSTDADEQLLEAPSSAFGTTEGEPRDDAADLVELSDAAAEILALAWRVHADRDAVEVLGVDVLLAALARTQAGSGGAAQALDDSLREPPARSERLAAAFGVVGTNLPSVLSRAGRLDSLRGASEGIVARASSLAERLTGSSIIRSRHLLAAAVTGPLDHAVLAELGCTRASLSAALLAYVRPRWPDESPSGWEEVLRSDDLAGSGGPPPAADAADRLPEGPAPLPVLADDGQRLAQMAASVAADSDSIDACAVVVAALADGLGEPSLPVAGEMLSGLIARRGPTPSRDSEGLERMVRAPGAEEREVLGRALLATSGRPTVHVAGPPDLSVPSTAALLATAAQMARTTSRSAEIAARHLLAAGVMGLDPAGDVIRELGPPEGIRGCLRHAITQTSPDDSGDAWDEILFGPDQRLGGGYTRDVGWPERGETDLSQDSLGRRDEAEMFAALITDDNLVPPLAIGLFGSWGSGKSFFMKLIHRAVTARVSDGSYAQIRFNAWHYSDANLWASLADEIFEQLADHLRTPEDDPASGLRQKLDLKSEARKDIEARRAQVVAAQVGLRAALRAAVIEKERARGRSSAAYAAQLARAITSDPDARHDLELIGKTLGISAPVEIYRALAGEARYLRDESAALSRGGRSRLRWSLITAAVGLVLVGALAAFVPSAVRAWAPAVAGTVAAGLAVVARIIGSAGQVATAARRFYGRVSAIDERVQTTPTQEQADLAGALREAEAAEAAATTQLSEVDARIAALQTELSELSGERQLYRFLVERADSGDYKAQLGIISIIRRDLETLVQLLRKVEQPVAGRPSTAALDPGEQTTGGPPPPALKRIVLYIDDLDRCEPKQGGAVLQAVNLLLGTPLFVVILGVDPTWLERSLRYQYDELVAGSTPREYLEKIIQVPYVLPAMADRFTTLMTSIVGPLAPEGQEGRPAATQPVEPPAGGVSGPVANIPVPRPADAMTVEIDSAAASGRDATPVQQPTAPTARELQMLTAVGPLVQTPRAATRLVNLYRLVRTTRDIGRSSRFLGTDGALADYLVVIPLLAIATRSPEVLAELNVRLHDQKNSGTWAELLGRPAPDHLQPDLEEITTALHALSARFEVPSDLAAYRTWAPRLARFTFTISTPATRNGAWAATAGAQPSRQPAPPRVPSSWSI